MNSLMRLVTEMTEISKEYAEALFALGIEAHLEDEFLDDLMMVHSNLYKLLSKFFQGIFLCRDLPLKCLQPS